MRRYGLMALLLLPIVCHAQPSENPMIGTPEKPTIEGGWINQAEKERPVNQNNKSVNQPSEPSKISDEFNSDKAIKKLLTLAAQQNKLAYVLQKAQQLKLPATVALIPIVESHYQTDAVSPKGASGAWQLMATTAKEYGLMSEYRENFPASTDTALKLLKNLHQQFGNWALAFAAYNAGRQRVMCALHQNPRAQFIDDLDVPLQTKRYIYRLKALYEALAKLSVTDRIQGARTRWLNHL